MCTAGGDGWGRLWDGVQRAPLGSRGPAAGLPSRQEHRFSAPLALREDRLPVRDVPVRRQSAGTVSHLVFPVGTPVWTHCSQAVARTPVCLVNKNLQLHVRSSSAAFCDTHGTGAGKYDLNFTGVSVMLIVSGNQVPQTFFSTYQKHYKQ